MKKNKEKKFPLNNYFTVAISIALALVCWVVVAGFIYPNDEVKIRGVAIDYKTGSSAYSDDLKVVGADTLPKTASITTSGSSSVLSNLQSDSVALKVDYSKVTGPGEYELPLIAVKNNSDTYKITVIDPEVVTMKFEEMVRKSIPVTIRADGIQPPNSEEYYRGKPVALPSEIEISGPKSDVDAVFAVVATVSANEVRTKTKIDTATLKLEDDQGGEISNQFIEMSATQVEVRVPILKQVELPIEIGLTGISSNFDKDWFRSLMTITPSTIKIAASEEKLSGMTSVHVGDIDLSDFSLGKEYDFDINAAQLPTEFENIYNVSQVVATFNTTDISTRKINIEDIRVENVPDGFEVTPVTTRIKNVTLMGPTADLAGLLSENVYAQVDLGDLTATAGQQKLPLRIIIPKSNKVWATGEYTIVCDVQTG